MQGECQHGGGVSRGLTPEVGRAYDCDHETEWDFGSRGSKRARGFLGISLLVQGP
jgi:hypothetical protein